MNDQTPTLKCPQCGQPMTVPVTARIIDRSRDPVTRRAFVRQRDLQFCSQKCGGHYQMGCEG
ncbi:hypothetical protein EAH88_11700 [Rhodanobacter glycinis]|uniref:Uncharacterized protein n=1 Tax=Rhodanobacter glycinis TaxID=582702 RepID=A0A502C958_9GAMM|nr:hypothetical protein EAH88_11700 [Rhodanobacter glycinis]